VIILELAGEENHLGQELPTLRLGVLQGADFERPWRVAAETPTTIKMLAVREIGSIEILLASSIS